MAVWWISDRASFGNPSAGGAARRWIGSLVLAGSVAILVESSATPASRLPTQVSRRGLPRLRGGGNLAAGGFNLISPPEDAPWFKAAQAALEDDEEPDPLDEVTPLCKPCALWAHVRRSIHLTSNNGRDVTAGSVGIRHPDVKCAPPARITRGSIELIDHVWQDMMMGDMYRLNHGYGFMEDDHKTLRDQFDGVAEQVRALLAKSIVMLHPGVTWWNRLF
jgi:hypothetical protein